MGKVSNELAKLIRVVDSLENAISDSQGWEEASCNAGEISDEEKRSMIQKRDEARMQLRRSAAQIINGFDALQGVVAARGDELGESL